MKLLILLVVVVLVLRIIMKVGSFFVKIAALGLLIFGLWYFKYDLVNQFDAMTKTFSLKNGFSSVFQWGEQLWSSLIAGLNNLI